MRGNIIFTDIVSSSKLWRTYGSKMSKALDKHEKRIKKLVAQHDAMIVKTIGDAYMMYVKSDKKAIDLAISIQRSHTDYPIYLDKKKGVALELRLGLASGELHKKRSKIQGCMLTDFFGGNVNIASRMESKVAPPGGIGYYSKKPMLDQFEHMNIHEIHYKKCKKIPKGRSHRLVSCRSADELKGVGSLVAYKITL